MHKKETPRHGLIAEFETPEQLIDAAKKAREEGYTKMDAYSPFPVHGLTDAMGFEDRKVPWIVFFGGLAGACAGAALQSYTAAIDYPLNIGGRALISTPSFIPVTFECTILFASFGALLSMIGLNLLPQPYHPVFEAPNFDRASQDRFFLCIEAKDPQFDEDDTRRFLEGLTSSNVTMLEGQE